MLGVMTHLEKRLDFCVKAPPLPISEFQIGSTIALQNSNGIELLSAFHVVPERAKMTGSDKILFSHIVAVCMYVVVVYFS